MGCDLVFTPQHESFRREVREFALKEIRPHSREWDKRGEFSTDAVRLMGRAGLLGILGPKELGGRGLDYLSLGIAIEELAGADISSALIAWVQNTLGHFFPGWAADTLRAAYRGEAVIALATSEENAGSDVSAMQTVAVPDGDHYIVNGTKIHVSMVPGADVLAVSCKIPSSDGKPLIGMLRVPAVTPGVSTECMPQLGARAHGLGIVRLVDVRIPREALMGEEGQGKALMYARFNVSRCMSPLAALGAASAALHETAQYARDKVVFGKPIAMNQAISFPLVEHRTRVEAARLMAYRALWKNDMGEDASVDAAMAKWFGITSGIDAITDCLPIFGANGYLEAWPIEQRMRDVMALQFTGGTINVMKLILVRKLLGDEYAGLHA